MNFFSLLIFIIFIVFSNSELDAKIEIRYKVGNEIITNIDVSNEKDYLTFLRPNLNNLANWVNDNDKNVGKVYVEDI